MKKFSSDNVLTVPVLSLGLLLLLSFVPWSDISNQRINDFSLFEDLMTEKIAVKTTELIDPLLEEAMQEVTADKELPIVDLQQSEPPVVNEQINHVAPVEQTDVRYVAVEKIDGVQPIEDFSADGCGLARFSGALANSDGRLVRIAVIGDSYIEGDILTQDIRRLLQSEYGGRGVGYMSMHSDFPGFRRSVVQSDAGWKVVDMRSGARDSIKTIAGEYCESTVGSKTSFTGAKGENVKSWSRSRLLFISPSDGVISITTASGPEDYEIEASQSLQALCVEGETSQMTIKTEIEGLKVLGAWMDDAVGISVDCMSLRGNSGVTHRQISVPLAGSMSEYVDYDLIVVEYGMNALSSEQSDYSSYSLVMSKVIARLKACYPNADILMLGVGDRGQKTGADVTSLPTVGAMTAAQRDCARKEGILFWDVRGAMGGENAIVDWRRKGLVNADYIHLNHKGGAVLAEQFVKSLKLKIDEYGH